jgi:hypothetical protein
MVVPIAGERGFATNRDAIVATQPSPTAKKRKQFLARSVGAYEKKEGDDALETAMQKTGIPKGRQGGQRKKQKKER